MPGKPSAGCLVAAICLLSAMNAVAADAPGYERDIVPLLKRHCVKCHGPAKQEGKLDLSLAGAIIRGGKQGASLVPHDIEASLLWQRVSSDEMPPETPLSDAEKAVLKAWIIAGAPGLPAKQAAGSAASHWSFQPVKAPARPVVRDSANCLNGVDYYVQTRLEAAGLTLSAPADRYAVLRRVSFDLTGLPPTPAEISTFIEDQSSDAYARMVERYLMSPHYGERLGKVWLDAAGYTDSNGYFNADSDRPLAYRYRDWVVRAFNRDLPYDQFVRDQLAGDEVANFIPDQDASPDMIEKLEATHYIRNGQDGSGESDGNPDEVRIDRYTALESSMQNISSSLLGLTIQCAKCHDHKFEPLTQRDYYAFQAVLAGVFAPDKWLKPNERVVYAALPGEFSQWKNRLQELDQQIQRQETDLAAWVKSHRPHGESLFTDTFDGDPATLLQGWSNQAPGDTAPAGKVAVQLNQSAAPASLIQGGQLQIIEGATQGSSGLSTKAAFDWTPNAEGGVVQVTFDLIADKLAAEAPGAARIGYYIALRDYNDQTDQRGGNILIDGNPEGGTAVHVDYPGDDNRAVGTIGTTGYKPGHTYGVRITNQGKDKYLLQHLCDWRVEEKTATLTAADLPDGGFGFEYCCGRSFIIDNVAIETFTPQTPSDVLTAFLKELEAQEKPLQTARQEKTKLDQNRPGKIALATDVAAAPPAIHLLLRGNHATPGPVAEPASIAVLTPDPAAFHIQKPNEKSTTSGRRLAWAQWVTQAGSRPAGLLARVHVNRLWQHNFGTGIVATPENLGISGSPPSHPELLEWLAFELVRSNWSTRHIERLILNSATYRQSSLTDEARLKGDPDSRLLSRFPVRRLDAEAIRDAMLAASGDLDASPGGPYVPTTRTGNGEVVVPNDQPGINRRSIYLQQRRSQVLSLLQVFDAPSIVFNSTRRARSTIPLQSLSLMNSEFSLTRAQHLAGRLVRDYPSEPDRLTAAVVLTAGHPPDSEELATLTQFLDTQIAEYEGAADARQRAWVDLCQMLLASNAFLYLE